MENEITCKDCHCYDKVKLIPYIKHTKNGNIVIDKSYYGCQKFVYPDGIKLKSFKICECFIKRDPKNKYDEYAEIGIVEKESEPHKDKSFFKKFFNFI